MEAQSQLAHCTHYQSTTRHRPDYTRLQHHHYSCTHAALVHYIQCTDLQYSHKFVVYSLTKSTVNFFKRFHKWQLLCKVFLESREEIMQVCICIYKLAYTCVTANCCILTVHEEQAQV